MRIYVMGIVTGLSLAAIVFSCLIILNVEAVRSCFPPP
jgi:hypothetical protein